MDLDFVISGFRDFVISWFVISWFWENFSGICFILISWFFNFVISLRKCFVGPWIQVCVVGIVWFMVIQKDVAFCRTLFLEFLGLWVKRECCYGCRVKKGKNPQKCKTIPFCSFGTVTKKLKRWHFNGETLMTPCHWTEERDPPCLCGYFVYVVCQKPQSLIRVNPKDIMSSIWVDKFEESP